MGLQSFGWANGSWWTAPGRRPWRMVMEDGHGGWPWRTALADGRGGRGGGKS
jgi:hypothetical protein